MSNKRYAGIMENDVVDGQGVCVSFWVQGCPHRCKGCHNPQTWEYDQGLELPDNYVDLVGQLLFKNNVKRNLSILGGEPLCEHNLDITYNLVKGIKDKFPETKIFLWTGYIYDNIINNPEIKKILDLADILVDGPFDLSHRDITLPLMGSPNQRIIDLHKSSKDNIVLGQLNLV